MSQRTKSLLLATETVRSLTSSELDRAAGGAPSFHGSFAAGSLHFGERVVEGAANKSFRGSFGIGSLKVSKPL